MKQCCRCNQEKPLSDFSGDRSSKDGYSARCKKCSCEYAHKQYKEKRAYCIEKSSRRVAKLIAENRQKREQYKTERGCRFCTERDPVALDFHHRDEKKEYTISGRMGSLTWEQLLKEIRKCDVVCSNCHRKLHAGRKLIALACQKNDNEYLTS